MAARSRPRAADDGADGAGSPGRSRARSAGRASAKRTARRLASVAMTGRGPLDARAGLSRCPSSSGSRPPPPPAVRGRPDRAAHGTGRCRRRPVRARRLGRPGRHRPPAPGGLARVEPAHPDARRGRPAPARRPPPRRRVPGDGRARRAARSSLKVSIGDLFATRCATCGRTLVVDEIAWSVDDEAGIAGRTPAGHPALPLHGLPRPARRLGAAPGAARRRRPATGRRPMSAPRRCAPACSPASRSSTGAEGLPDELLDLHTRPPARRPRRDPRADRGRPARGAGPGRAPPRAPPRHPAGQPARRPGRAERGALRVVVRPRPAADAARSSASATRGSPSRTRFRLVRGFIQRLEAGTTGPDPGAARRGPAQPRRGRGDHGPRASSRSGRPASRCATTRTPTAGPRPTPRVRLVLGQPPMRPSLERLARRVPRARPGCSVARRRRCCRSTRWPVRSLRVAVELAGGRARPCARGRRARRWPATAGSSSSSTAGRRRSSRRCSAAATAGYRLLGARLADADDDAAAIVELLPPGRPPATGARTRANVGLDPLPGGAGDPDVVPSTRPVRAAGAVRRAAVLGDRCGADRDRGRGRDPPRAGRAGPLRAPARRDPRRPRSGRPAPPARDGDARRGDRPADGDRGRRRRPTPADARSRTSRRRRRPRPPSARRPHAAAEAPIATPRPTRSTASSPSSATSSAGRPSGASSRSSPGRWWLADRDDLAAAAVPLADRVEWAVFSLLSTAGPLVRDRVLRPDRVAVQRSRPARRRRSSRPASRATAAWPARPSG